MTRFASLIGGVVLALAAAPALAQPAPSPERLALAERLITSMQLDRQMEMAAAQMEPVMVAQLKRGNPDMSEQEAAVLAEAFSRAMPPMMTRLKGKLAALYASTFNEQELRDTTAFYESASGRAVLEKMPTLTAKMMPLMFDLMPAMMEDVRAHLCGKVDCTKLKLPPPPKA